MDALNTVLQLALLSGFLFISPVYLQGTNCSCFEGQLSTWGIFFGSDRCVGRCDNAALIRKRYCHVFGNNGRFQNNEQCSIVQKSSCGECAGEWSSWSNAGRCTGRCGKGVQLQHRACYRRNTPGRNIRVNECSGGGDSFEQSRNVTCRRRIIIECTTPRPSTTTIRDTSATSAATTLSQTLSRLGATTATRLSSSITTSATTTATTQTTTTTSQITTTTTSSIPSPSHALPTQGTLNEATSHSNELEGDKNSKSNESPSDLEEPAEPTLLSPGGFDTITLAAVLGSVAIVCVTIVAIAVAIVFIRRHDAKKKALTLSNTSAGNNFVKIDTNVTRNDYNYNAVKYPPTAPLPSQTSSYGQVANPLYETTLMNGEPITTAIPKPVFSQQTRRISNDATRSYEVDPIYFSVDDYNR